MDIIEYGLPTGVTKQKSYRVHGIITVIFDALINLAF